MVVEEGGIDGEGVGAGDCDLPSVIVGSGAAIAFDSNGVARAKTVTVVGDGCRCGGQCSRVGGHGVCRRGIEVRFIVAEILSGSDGGRRKAERGIGGIIVTNDPASDGDSRSRGVVDFDGVGLGEVGMRKDFVDKNTSVRTYSSSSG